VSRPSTTSKLTRAQSDVLAHSTPPVGSVLARNDEQHIDYEGSWQEEARVRILHLIYDRSLHMCSRLTIEYEVESVDLSFDRYKNTHEYDERFKRAEHSFRRGLEQEAASVRLPTGDFSAEDISIPISKWCLFACRKGGSPGAFEVNLIVQNPGQPLLRVPVYSKLKSGAFPDARAIMNFLSSVLPRVRAANPTGAEAYESAVGANNTPRSALAIIASSAAAEERRQAEMVMQFVNVNVFFSNAALLSLTLSSLPDECSKDHGIARRGKTKRDHAAGSGANYATATPCSY